MCMLATRTMKTARHDMLSSRARAPAEPMGNHDQRRWLVVESCHESKRQTSRTMPAVAVKRRCRAGVRKSLYPRIRGGRGGFAAVEGGCLAAKMFWEVSV